MLDNIAKTSYRSLVQSQVSVDTSHTCTNNASTVLPDDTRSNSYISEATSHHSNDSSTKISNSVPATPARANKRPLVAPNAPRISRRRIMNPGQYSAARRNIFYYLINEE